LEKVSVNERIVAIKQCPKDQHNIQHAHHSFLSVRDNNAGNFMYCDLPDQTPRDERKDLAKIKSIQTLLQKEFNIDIGYTAMPAGYLWSIHPAQLRRDPHLKTAVQRYGATVIPGEYATPYHD
jgi:hypothetical protein